MLGRAGGLPPDVPSAPQSGKRVAIAR